MRGAHVLSFAVLFSSFSGSVWAQPSEPAPPPPEATPPEKPKTGTSQAPNAQAPNAQAKPKGPMRLRIPLMRGMVNATPSSPNAEQPRALAPSHGPAVAPAPKPAAEPLSPVSAAAPRVFEFGDPNVALDGHPLSGYHGGLFYVRNRTDYFRLFLRSRLHIDSYNYFGPAVKHTNLKSTMILRRAHVELGGELMGHWQWEVQMEAGPTGFSNAVGTDQSSAAPAGTDPTSTTATYASPQGARYSARPIHAYINYRASDAFNIKLGQFNVPFTAENRTSTNRTSFMERALPSRAWGVPLVKDIGGMIWGHTDKRRLFWSWAVMQGEGENRPNADNRALTAMRIFTRPLARGNGPLELLQLGASFKYAMHDKNRVAYDYPAMSTQSGYRFWSPTYTDSVGSGRRIHIIPSGAQVGVAGELRVPYDRFDLRSEFVYLNNNTREGVDGFQADYTERFGTLKGYAYHVTLSYCLLGKPLLTGNPGDRKPPRLQLNKTDPGVPPHALDILVKWEQLNAKYESASRGGQIDAKNADGDIRVNVASAGVNYWASRHLRLTLNYMLNMFPDSAPTSTPDQRAKAPGNRIEPGVEDEARDSAHTLHELAARVAVAF